MAFSGIIASILFVFFFILSIKGIVDKSSIYIIYTILCSISFGVMFLVSMGVFGN